MSQQYQLDAATVELINLIHNEVAPHVDSSELVRLRDKILNNYEYLAMTQTVLGQLLSWMQTNYGWRLLDQDNNSVDFPITS